MERDQVTVIPEEFRRLQTLLDTRRAGVKEWRESSVGANLNAGLKVQAGLLEYHLREAYKAAGRIAEGLLDVDRS